jgi:N-formylglutamate amidohydrolase
MPDHDHVVVHIPHAALDIPSGVRPSLVLSDAELGGELLRMTDRYTDELFAAPGCEQVAFSVSRLVVDPERFLDDAQEPMARVGMGVVYTRTAGGLPLRHGLTAEEREGLIRQYYTPHHARLTAAVNRRLEALGGCLIVDGHSFPAAPLPYEFDQRLDRPAFCIGTDDFHAPEWLTEAAVNFLSASGLSVAVNRPFAGALVPLDHYRRNPKVFAIMVEVNRALYMDEATGERSEGFDAVRELTTGLVLHLSEVAGRHLDALRG